MCKQLCQSSCSCFVKGWVLIGLNPRWISSVINLSAMVILYYDYMITLSREIQFLWPPHNKQGWITAVYLVNRYISVLGYLPLVVSFFIPLDLLLYVTALCAGMHAYSQWLMIFTQTLTGFLCVVRVYAMYGKNRRLLGVFVITAVISVVTGAGAILASYYKGGDVLPVLSSFGGCLTFMPSSKGRFYDIAWVGVSFSDSVIFSLTLYKALKIGRGVQLLDVIVRDGTMYFLYEPFSLLTGKTLTTPNRVLFIMNLVNIFNLRFSSPFLRSSTATVTNVLSATLVSRLVLNLREQNATLMQEFTTVETMHRFQAALPISQELLTVGILPSYHPNSSIYETATIGAFGMPYWSQSVDVIDHEI
ncbi:hypothetical protein BC827DRAFT_1376884 [Russula dissimulans]|nr:hypothetical protein BC827DRAFT_1376884 [Russula dissimulans]